MAETIASVLREYRYSITKQRQQLFDLLIGEEPLSMREVTAKAAPYMDRASAYRTIEIFERIGVVRRVHIGWKYKIELSDRFVKHHHHLTCVRCKRIILINEQTLETFIEKLTRSYHFRPTEHQIELQGYCEDCQKAESVPGAAKP